MTAIEKSGENLAGRTAAGQRNAADGGVWKKLMPRQRKLKIEVAEHLPFENGPFENGRSLAWNGHNPLPRQGIQEPKKQKKEGRILPAPTIYSRELV
ncbi:MAG: hypothetical protein O3C49_10805 [Proteobacteria bacterium]|nr:hypothetical protein [Pseudomonadota bacterium]MDA1323511.1 hypothetical protein [Pseudomonadota bacterium]